MINLLIESINEWNKFYYVVDLNQKWVCFNDIYSQCNDLLTLIILLISESIHFVTILALSDSVF